MANILRDELIENNYVSTNNIDNELPPTHVVLYLKNISGIDKKTVIEPIPLQQVLLTNQNPSLKLIDNKAIFCLSPPSLLECIPIVNEVSCLCLDTTENYKVTVDGEEFTGSFEDVVTFLDSHGLYAYPSETTCNPPLPPKEISCEGATNTSGCIDIEGLWDLEIDGVRILSDVTPQQIESYLINESPHITNHPSCCFNGYYRSVFLPYPIQEGSTVYIPIALTPDGESITTPMVAQGPDPYNNIGEQLAIQLEPHGLYAHNSMFSIDNNTSFGITYYDATAYNNTFFYILDEGNTFSEEQMPRGLPPYRCFFLS